MDVKKLALELLVKVNLGDVTLEELNSELAALKEQMSEIGDEGSEEFKEAAAAVEELEGHIETVNTELKKTKEGFEDTSKAQKDAAKGSSLFSKGVKAVGTAFKALGIGAIVAGLKFLFDALSQNEKVMKVVKTATEAISIVFSQVVETVANVVEQFYQSSNSFEELTKVIKGLLTIGLTPLKVVFNGTKLAIQQAQLAWEQSFFGGGDEAKIKQLTEDIKETKESIKETGQEALQAGKDVVTNLGKAGSEISGVVSGAVEGIQEISVKGAIEQAKTNVELVKSAEIAAARQAGLVEKYDRLAEQQRQIRDEERNSIEDRKKANDELNLILDEQEKAMLAAADAQLAAAKAAVAKNKNTETTIALIDAQTNREGVLAQIEGLRSEQKANDLALDREKMEMLKSISDSEASLSFERKKFNAEQIEDKLLSLETLRALEEENQQEEMLRLEGIVEMAQAGTQAEVDALIALDEFREASRQQNLTRDKEIEEEKAKRLLDEQKKKIEALQAESEIEEDNFRARRADLRRRQALLLEDETLSNEQRIELKKKFDEESEELDKDFAERKKERDEALKQSFMELANTLVDFASASSRAEEDRLQDTINNTEEGTEAREKAEKALEKQKEKSFKIEQNAAIGRALISTAQGAIQAYNSQIIPFDPSSIIRGAIAAALVTSAGLAQVATIKKQKFYGSGGAGISPPSQPNLGEGDVGTQPRGFTSPTVDTEVPTTKVIVTETDIRSVSRNVDGVYSRATVVQ